VAFVSYIRMLVSTPEVADTYTHTRIAPSCAEEDRKSVSREIAQRTIDRGGMVCCSKRQFIPFVSVREGH
jgi:hypothetical protein